MRKGMRSELTAARLRYLLDYDRANGIFRWKVSPSNAAPVGSIAGHRHSTGYVRIKVDGFIYPASRLAWLYVKGEWPKGDVDHHDMNRSNDRWKNLRDASRSQNKGNGRAYRGSATGLKGAYCTNSGHAKQFRSFITVGGKRVHLGYFATAEEAHAAYAAAAHQHFGEFARAA